MPRARRRPTNACRKPSRTVSGSWLELLAAERGLRFCIKVVGSYPRSGKGPPRLRATSPIEPVCLRARLINWPPLGRFIGGIHVRLGILRHQDFGLAAAAVVICLGLYGGFAAGFYSLMQPTVVENRGVAAYKPPPATVVVYSGSPFVPPAPSQPAALVELTDPAPEVLESTEVAPKKETKKHAARPAPRRERQVRERRDSMWDFASRPSHGYRPWF
jgi:hypothetical protein